jgi:ABC-type Na+ efflux pump permease subunit
MSGLQIQLNQFGLDGAGVKALLLAPLGAREILVGKALGLLVFQGLQAALLLILLGSFGDLSIVQALAGLCMAGSLFLVQVGLGHWTSAWMPRTMPRSSLKNSNQAQPVIWLGMAALLVGFLVFGGTYLLMAWLTPRLLLPVMALLLGLVFLTYKHFILPATARYLDSRREALVQALG